MRLPFAIRLAAVVMLTIMVVGIGHERYASQAFREGFVAERLQAHRTDARWIEDVVADQGPDRAIVRAQEMISVIGTRPGVESVELVAANLRVVAAADPRRVARHNPSAVLATAEPVPSGRDSARQLDRGRERARQTFQRLEFIVPLSIEGKRFALIVTEDARMFDARIAAIDREILIAGLISLPLAVGLFFLLGGRDLTGHHAWALRQSSRDPLTGVGNHTAYQECMEVEWEAARRHGDPFVLVLIDIDDFKLHNDRLGHEYGDRILTQVAAVLGDVRPTDKCFRLGGDEFAVILPRTGTRGAEKAMERALQRVAEEVPGIHLSVGLAVSTSATENGVILREQADAAAYEAKKVNGSAIVVFDEIPSATALAAPDKLLALDELIAEGDFDVAFQPI